MIQVESMLHVCDNSGGKTGKCIKLLGGTKKTEATFADELLVSIQKIKTHERKKIKLKSGNIIKGLFIRCKKKSRRSNFSYHQCKYNGIVLLSKNNKPIATRVIGSVPKELKSTKFMKVALLSSALY